MWSQLLILIIAFYGISAFKSPEEVLLEFQTSWVTGDCQKMYQMMAPQPLGNWMANAEGPNTYTILNRTNIVQICEMFNSPNAIAAWYVLPNFSYNTHVTNQEGFIGFTSTFTFKQKDGSVCNVVWQDLYQARVENETIVEMWEFYNANEFGKQWQHCSPMPELHNAVMNRFGYKPWIYPIKEDKENTNTILSVTEQVRTAFYNKQCDSLVNLADASFKFVDVISGITQDLKDFVTYCNNKTYGEQASSFTMTELSKSIVQVSQVFAYAVMDPVRDVPCTYSGPETQIYDFVYDNTGMPKLSKLSIMYAADDMNHFLLNTCHFQL